MLDPNSRSLYTAALTPPPGMSFSEAIATTFSLDPAFLLEAPVYLAFMAASAQGEQDPLIVVNAIRKYVENITVYVQRGRVQVPPRGQPSPLYGHLEELIVQVTAPGGGTFHPKLWLIRFLNAEEAPFYRLMVLTRNMTTDTSWDLALQLEGVPREEDDPTNEPLAHLVNSLPGMATQPLGEARTQQARRFSAEVRRVEWERPTGYDQVRFYLPGSQGFAWKPPSADRIAVISPFCSDHSLKMLAQQAREAAALISTPDALSKLNEGTLKLFKQVLHLDEAAESDDGEDETSADTGHGALQASSRGLHAKAYLFETRRYAEYTHVVMGSANATNAALLAGKNVELLVELIGKKRLVGGIDDLLGADGLGEFLVEFASTAELELDEQGEEAAAALEAARSTLCTADLGLRCTRGSQDDTWQLTLVGYIPPLPGLASATAWPITVPQESAVSILAHAGQEEVSLGEFSTASVTGLIAFELRYDTLSTTLKFVLNLPVQGLPEERDAAILRTVIKSQDGFIRYLLLLLSNEATAALGAFSGLRYADWISSLTAGEDVPLLEELTRAFSREPDRLEEVAELVRYLSTGKGDGVIPSDFIRLWSVYEDAMRERDA